MVGSQGQPRPHYALAMEREARAEVLRGLQEFGGTALSRVRLGIAEVQRRSLHEELIEAIGPSPRVMARPAEVVEDPPRRSPLAAVLAEPEE